MNSQEKTENWSDWFLRGLAAKIEHFNRALAALRAGKAEAASDLRSQAQALAEKATHYGIASVSHAALQVVSSPDQALESSVRALQETMIKAKAEAVQEPLTVLVIGGTRQFVALFQGKFTPTPEMCRIIRVESAAEAERVLLETRVATIVLHADLPDIEGEALFTRLRNGALITSIPVLVLGERLSDSLKEQVGMSDAHGYLEGEADANSAAAWVTTRLRRVHQRARRAWRDRPTGLLTREAFTACFREVQKDCEILQEPLSLAIVRVDQTVVQDVTDRIGTILSEYFRSTDVLARWGPGTFAVLFPGEDQFGARKAIERVRQAVSKANLRMEGEADFRVTLSAGIAAVSSDQSIHEAASEAERYLVRATAVGNGQIVSKQTRLIRRPQNVLLLTANQLIRMVLGGVLERDGFRVTFATDARQAAGLFEGRKRFHLIVIDEDIPPGGLHALRSLKKMERSLRVPAVMVLAKESGERREEYHGAGAVACFSRPLDVSACVEKIREFVSTASPFRDPLSRMCRVLVVDEEPMQLYLAASSLDAYGGFLVSLAKGEEDAVRRLHDDLPEALIVPEAMLKRHSPDEFSLHGTPVLATDMDVILTTDSAVSRSGNAEEGIKGMLGKPFDCLSLGRTIEEMLGLSSSRSRDKASPDHVNREMQRIAGLAGSRARS